MERRSAAEGALVFDEAMEEAESTLAGGDVAAAVVRVGSTVRKPITVATPAVEAVLQHLEKLGFDGAPRWLSRDEQGRQVLEYVDGPHAHDLAKLDLRELRRVGRLVRDLHDALAGFSPAAGRALGGCDPTGPGERGCHHDLGPWNLVLSEQRWVFIDWDNAGPGSPLWDLAYAAQTFAPLQRGGDPALDVPRLRALVDGYDLDDAGRLQLPGLLERRSRGMYDLLVDGARTGRQPWARLYAHGHAAHWGPAADYIGEHRADWAAALIR